MKQTSVIVSLLASLRLVYGEAMATAMPNPEANPTASAEAAPMPTPNSSTPVATPVEKAGKDTKAPASTKAGQYPPYGGGSPYQSESIKFTCPRII